MIPARWRLLTASVALLVLAAAPALAQPMPGMKMDGMTMIDLPMPLVTGMAMPMNWVELMVMHSKSEMERMYQAFPSAQYLLLPGASLQLTVPLTIRDPREDEPTVGGIGDVELTGRYAPVILEAEQFVLTGGLTLTFPTGSEQRELGGEWALAPFVQAAKGLGPLSLHGEVRYRWRLDSPDSGDEKEQRFTANLAAIYMIVKSFGVLVELNSVTVVEGDEEMKHRVQLYVTPGISAEPAKGWSVRAGVQIPVTSAKEFDYNVVAVLTRVF